MSKVEQVEASIDRLELSRDELKQIRDWLDDILDDEKEFSPEFEAKIAASEKAMQSGNPSRVIQK